MYLIPILHTIFAGHSGRVNCLLYPHNEHPRYDVAHLVSGSVDFSVCLWDIYSGQCLHRFSAHAGEITNLYVPPASCSPRIQQCICSVASDHSVTLLSLKERRTVLLASRHMFPVTTIKWRPLGTYSIPNLNNSSCDLKNSIIMKLHLQMTSLLWAVLMVQLIFGKWKPGI